MAQKLRKTTLPLYSDRVWVLPFWSTRVKSGAGKALVCEPPPWDWLPPPEEVPPSPASAVEEEDVYKRQTSHCPALRALMSPSNSISLISSSTPRSLAMAFASSTSNPETVSLPSTMAWNS